MMSRVILSAIVSCPIVALLLTLAAETTSNLVFYTSVVYAALVGLSALMSVTKTKGTKQ
jgi:hypothetical protein